MLCSERCSDPQSLEAYLACRLIPLDKNPGLRPIGIGEVIRRIIGKAVVACVRRDIIHAAGNLQLCAGIKSGCEIAVHAAVDLFADDETQGILQIDAANAFNSINRAVTLHNMNILCPEFSTYVTNCYQTPANLFIDGGRVIQSLEGTTQGDPVAMAMYAIGIIPLLHLPIGPLHHKKKSRLLMISQGWASSRPSVLDTMKSICTVRTLGTFPNPAKAG